ncbi:rhodanese-like domain-containing protein [Planosporangium thailandense]|uniref:Rhodanese-like domain-containing protein n=1 Tax=Planosporangium thailandense TaxID=765197 RepID=A0ABX0XUP6_9ACTN|nr:rhodanese-like domain-containing protein [Planosporangium thailandense]
MFGRNQVPGVGADEVPAEAYLLDVREDDEWAAGHAPDARHMPMHTVPARLDEIPTDGDVVVVCRSGGRSAQVVAYLLAAGRDNVRNLDGGMMAWARAGRPMISEDGGAPQVA